MQQGIPSCPNQCQQVPTQSGDKMTKLTELSMNKLTKEEKISKDEALDNLLALEKKLTMIFDSDVRVGLALLDEIRKLNQKRWQA
jgi:hypothetical protein